MRGPGHAVPLCRPAVLVGGSQTRRYGDAMHGVMSSLSIRRMTRVSAVANCPLWPSSTAEGSYDEFDDGDDYDDSDLDLGMGSASGTNVLGVEEVTADIGAMATDDTDDLMGNGLRRRL